MRIKLDPEVVDKVDKTLGEENVYGHGDDCIMIDGIIDYESILKAAEIIRNST